MKRFRRILLVEDEENDRELTIHSLASAGLVNVVDAVRDGEEALSYLRRLNVHANRGHDQPLLVMLDLKMPKVDGIEVLRQMRNDPELRLIPVVVLTSSKEDSDLRRCYELGVNAYVVKPVDFNQFVSAVKQLGLFWAVLNEPPPADDESFDAAE